ncbi:probable GIT1 Glycerophosphoinositol transporter also able to mediate low-affinity phosphate transport [Phialocephala subalpina]|uniref:Probable GIT1 Glycerophosphoinositol transporter also able to mediate low-affinity phosphate transport n=1 Tax=Phialocephala subalpina TaxID=576137 RepID=A0A1L7XAD8_9HELO|nr:probable GIT1 Glycerophosphoinositol transporter also able to mediate low-affinity phosphate transport [Phialocephala subalpina]
MATLQTTVEAGTPIEEKDAKVITEESTSDLESDSASARRPGSIWTLIGCALANFSDGYQQSLASSTNVVFNHLLTTKVYTSAIQTRISNALLVGSVIGIVVLGYTSDKFSRKGGMLFTSSPRPHGSHNMLWFLTIARGIAGVGVGGEYPSSAAAALEGSNEHFDNNRGPIQVLISTLMATSGAPICTFVYLASLLASNNNLKVAYHAIYSISIILPLFVILFRLKMQDGKLFQKSNFKKRHVPWVLVLRKYWLRLLGTSSAFFLYDFVNFPNSIMSAAIINSIVPGKNVRTVAVWQLILALFPVPGVLLGAWLVNRIGRKWTGVLGFGGYVVLGFIIGGCYEPLTTKSIPAFVVLYGLFQCLGHMGPGATIGLMSVESYPTAVRAMGYGISAGFGKAGAAIGTQAFTPIEAAAGKAATFYVAGGVGVLGTIIYCFLPEGRAVDLAIMDEEFERYMKEEGYVDKMGEESR